MPDIPICTRQSERYPACREIIAQPNYVVVYQVKADVIEVLRVLQARQQYP